MNPFDDSASYGPHYGADEPAGDAGFSEHAALQTWQREPENETFSSGDGRTWEHELPRWLATLNPGRTGHEYEKALRYFFETPGVPQHFSDMSFDLLLAYRGALALRATSRERPQARRGMYSAPSVFDAQLGAPQMAALPAHEAASTDEYDSQTRMRQQANSLLAPATVNIRLTALRQFLVHCASMGLLSPTLTPDRIRAALRRLSIERRRPYQVLAEREWGDFLQAALAPAHEAAKSLKQQSDGAPDSDADAKKRGPWGMSRAERAEIRGQVSDRDAGPSNANGGNETGSASAPKKVSHSRAGLTGARTAQRDHALLSLALATGLRAIELVSLDVGDLAREWHEGREEWWLVLPDAKTKGQHGGRTLPLAPTLVQTLLAYVKSTDRRWEAASDRSTPLFLSLHSRKTAGEPVAASNRPKKGQSHAAASRLSTTQVREIVDRVEAEWLSMQSDQPDGRGVAGESRTISPHALRHSTALALLEGDGSKRPPASVEHVRGWLGHFDIRTTQGYLAHLDARKNRRPFVIDTVGEPRAIGENSSEVAAEADSTSNDEQC